MVMSIKIHFLHTALFQRVSRVLKVWLRLLMVSISKNITIKDRLKTASHSRFFNEVWKIHNGHSLLDMVCIWMTVWDMMCYDYGSPGSCYLTWLQWNCISIWFFLFWNSNNWAAFREHGWYLIFCCISTLLSDWKHGHNIPNLYDVSAK